MNVEKWLRGPIDEKTRQELIHLVNTNPKELLNAFSQELSFGTSGMRGLMGVGTNRLNRYTVAKAAQAMANYLSRKKRAATVGINYDNRHHSLLFATTCAAVFAAAGIKVFILKEIRPNPYLSFVIRLMKWDGGVMITASHNPKEYNGFEVFDAEGGEIPPEIELEIDKEFQKLGSFDQIHQVEGPHPLIEWLDPIEGDKAYLSAIASLQWAPSDNRSLGSTLKITYTSLHGTGITLAPKALQSWGFTNLNFVKEQIVPDPEFSTLKDPNPGEVKSLELGIKQLLSSGSDLLIANDADADRIGVVVLHQGKERVINGNEFAAICAYYLAASAEKNKKLPKNGAFVISYVTTEVIKAIASSFGIACFEVPTGFKYIVAKINEWEHSGSKYQFLFGAEESCGCLLGTYARNKDGIAGACFIAEIALQAKIQGKTLVDLLEEIYQKYGIFREKLLSLKFSDDLEGAERKKNLMQSLRKGLLKEVAGKRVIEMEDFYPPSDTLQFRLEDQSKIIIRPSGTEASMRIHAAVHVKDYTSAPDGIEKGDQQLDLILNSLKQSFLSF